jgi:hypothetical protein
VVLELPASTAMHIKKPIAAITIGIVEKGNGAIGNTNIPMPSVIEMNTMKKHATAHFAAPVFGPSILAI